MIRESSAGYRILCGCVAALALALMPGDAAWNGTPPLPAPGVLMVQTDIENKKDVILQRYRDKKEELVRSPEEMKQMLAEIQKNIKEKNMHFVVGINEMMKYKISDITGIQVPRNIEKDAKVQSELGKRLWNEFMKKYREHLHKESDGGERFRKKGKRGCDYCEEMGDDERAIKDEAEEKEIKKNEPAAGEERKKKDEQAEELMRTDIDNAPSPDSGAFDWAGRNAVSPAKLQGICGSCWAFSSLAAMEANFMIRKNWSVDLSEQHILDCAVSEQPVSRGGRVVYVKSKAGTCQGGWYGPVFEYCLKHGVPLETQVPYLFRESTCVASGPSRYTIVSWGYVRADAGIPSVREMKEALCTYGPVVACVKITPALQAYRSGIFDEFVDCSGEKDINHAVTIVGWDDDRQAYRVKNSWGSEWGEKGFCWIRYGCNNIGYGAAWVVVNSME
ncbi:MAG: hypothetical protein JXA07_11620 [Spirochaetes bacterium]|nr:hypothetical protein [Spirochaetota bacterium]